jgi:hypothetical protein
LGPKFSKHFNYTTYTCHDHGGFFFSLFYCGRTVPTEAQKRKKQQTAGQFEPVFKHF